MTLNHSKTWPVGTLAVVQLRVDLQGRTYSSLAHPQKEEVNVVQETNQTNLCNLSLDSCSENGVLYPLSKKHVDLFNRMSSVPSYKTTVRTDTISTLLDPIEFESDKQEEQVVIHPLRDESQTPETPVRSSNNNGIQDTQKYHVLALTRIDENVNESECMVRTIGRRPSIKVDNWDYIYTEAIPNPQNRCPIHCFNQGNGDTNQAKESLIPEPPLDARKTTTLRRHYYPEGGWGWVIVVCAVLVHVLNHGVQLSCSQLVFPGSKKFRVDSVHFAGEPSFFQLSLKLN